QGVVGRVFGNDTSSSNYDRYVERLIDCISNGVLAEDRRSAMTELLSIVVESHAAQLAVGAIGFPVLLGVLKEERDDVEMVRGALETLVGALNPIEHGRVLKSEVQPALMNSDLLSREAESISIILSLLSEEDFYVRYYTLQLLTTLVTKSPSRIQEAILTIPGGVTNLVDMLMDREVIRNEALLLLTYLTREAEEIQKILVFEGAFEKIFSIITEEGGSEGGVVVQDCLELLKNLLRHNPSNQVALLRETVGFDLLISILKLRGSFFKFTQQKTINLLSTLDTIGLLLHSDSQSDPGKDARLAVNKTVFVQKRALDHLLMLGVESRWAPVATRCKALNCIAVLVSNHPKNRDTLASMVLGGEPNVEPALNSILRIILRTSSVQEFFAADYIFKSFCEGNHEGQRMLASTLIPQPLAMIKASVEEDVKMSFGSLLLHGLASSESDGDLEACCRAASVLSHVLKDNSQCKDKVLKIELEAPLPSYGGPEPLMHRMMRYLALASSVKNKDGKSSATESIYFYPIILKLLVLWLFDSPSAVRCFLDSRHHLNYLIDLFSSQNSTPYARGLAAVLLGECISYNTVAESEKNAYSVVDIISQKIGMTSYLAKFNELHESLCFPSEEEPDLGHKALTRSPAASMSEIEDDENKISDINKDDDHSLLTKVLDSEFIDFVKGLEATIREKIVETYSHPKSQVVVVPLELEQASGESNEDYIKRLRQFLEKQCIEIQDLLRQNATLAEEVAKTGGRSRVSSTEEKGSRVEVEALGRQLRETNQRMEKLTAEALAYRSTAGKLESDLKSLSDAYNSLENANFELEKELKLARSGGGGEAEATTSEAELNDLLVCLGQEQSKNEKLSARLIELGEDVDKLLECIREEDDDDDDDDDD
ncbi:hypothetical protein M569_04427, partial [Genlisea aurea]